ncbi:hypothetical protein AOQ84DRAFT_379460 [Glonium stellatum]|uniref:Uncharacterized protein n=1 Tax=Glonium stellatum TaxID=574774 RepID=A0A8E2EVR3_9PEZI|nr:hypothetical protein AOQ84DRAFT_379460 [Glonium stellatum]
MGEYVDRHSSRASETSTRGTLEYAPSELEEHLLPKYVIDQEMQPEISKRPGRSFSLRLNPTIPWIATTVFFALYSAFLATKQHHSSPQVWRETDFIGARNAISVVERKFTTGIRAYENGTLYRTFDSEEPLFVGEPSPEIDANWDRIVNIDTQAFYITPEEASTIGGNPYFFKKSGVYEIE